MLLSELITALKEDVDDATLGFYTAKRAFERSAAQVNKDASTSYVVSGDDESEATITPSPTSQHQEALLILAARYLAGQGRINASNRLSWKSGDKSVDRSRQALTKKEIVDGLWAEYVQLMGLDSESLVSAASFEHQGSDD